MHPTAYNKMEIATMPPAKPYIKYACVYECWDLEHNHCFRNSSFGWTAWCFVQDV